MSGISLSSFMTYGACGTFTLASRIVYLPTGKIFVCLGKFRGFAVPYSSLEHHIVPETCTREKISVY